MLHLQVMKDTPSSEVRANYMRLSRLVHPDKCSNPQAGAASAILNQVRHGRLVVAMLLGVACRFPGSG